MKWRAISIVSMLMISAMFVGAGSSLAVPFSGTISFNDGWNVQDYFEPGDGIYFDVTVLDDGSPLQYATVNVTIIGDGIIGEVFNYTSYETDQFGQFDGYHGDDFWWTHDVGNYVMYVNYSDQEVVSRSFSIYEPVPWEADCWTAYYGDVTDEFTESQRVDVYVQADDQYGNPYYNPAYGNDIEYEIYREGHYAASGNVYTDNAGDGIVYYYPNGAAQFGTYMVTIYNDASPAQAIGFCNFTVVLPDRAVIWPQYYGENRTVFTEGETMGYEIQMFYDNTIPYYSYGQAARILLFHESNMDYPLRNNSFSTDYDGSAYDTYFYSIGYGDSYKGVYYLWVYNQEWDIIGSTIFMVIDMDIDLLPYKSVYSQGDEVQISISTSLEDAYTVKITDYEHEELSGASWDVPAGTSEWLKDFTFPNIDDGTYHVGVYMDDLLLGYHTFQLKKFTIEVRLSQDAFLPGQYGTLYWRAVDNHDGGPITISGDTEMNYLDDDWDYVTDTLDDLKGSAGDFEFRIPRDAMIGGTGGNINIDAEDTKDHEDFGSASFQVGSLYVSVSKDRTSYRPGDSVYMTFTSSVGGSSSMVPNVDIKARAQYDGTTVGDTWTITTDNSGQVNFVYKIPSDADDGLFVIVMNATFDDNRDIKYNGTSEFTVTSNPVISLELYQEISFYAPGDTVDIPYRVLKDGVVTNEGEISYEAWLDGETIALGFGSGGVISFDLPADLEGSLSVQASAITDDGTAFDQIFNIPVTNANIILFTTKSIYLPGENVTWVYVLNGDTASTATYRITDSDGVLLAEGTIVGDNFTYTLPLEYANAPTATIYVTGADDTYITANTASVYEGYIIEFWILQNSYAPGDIMEINYTIIKIGHGPEIIGGFQVQIAFWGEFTDTIWVTEETGIISYQLPEEELTDGKHLVMVSLGGGGTFDDYQTVIIDSDAGELAHGTTAGLNTGAFIALLIGLIGLIIAIIGVMMARKKGKSGDAAPAEPEPTTPEPEPAMEEPTLVESYPPPPTIVEEGAEQPGDYPPPPTNY